MPFWISLFRSPIAFKWADTEGNVLFLLGGDTYFDSESFLVIYFNFIFNPLSLNGQAMF